MMESVEGYRDSSYGEGIADVYDAWYGDVSDVDATVDLVAELATGAGAAGRVLELGVGTGRLAVPLAARGLTVHGIDASAAMLARLRERDPSGRIAVTAGDMVGDLPAGPFDVVLVAYNTLFNLRSAERQRACFAAVADCLTPGGTFVVEVFVPDLARAGDHVGIRSMTVDRVVLDVSRHDPHSQRAEGQLVELAAGRPVRLRPWSIRYAAPAELDAMAAGAGLALTDRWADFHRTPFDAHSERHVSAYRPRAAAVGGQATENHQTRSAAQ